jgi:hypothetical protein
VSDDERTREPTAPAHPTGRVTQGRRLVAHRAPNNGAYTERFVVESTTSLVAAAVQLPALERAELLLAPNA